MKSLIQHIYVMDLSKYMKLRSGKQIKKPIGGKNKTKKNRKHN